MKHLTLPTSPAPHTLLFHGAGSGGLQYGSLPTRQEHCCPAQPGAVTRFRDRQRRDPKGTQDDSPSFSTCLLLHCSMALPWLLGSPALHPIFQPFFLTPKEGTTSLKILPSSTVTGHQPPHGTGAAVGSSLPYNTAAAAPPPRTLQHRHLRSQTRLAVGWEGAPGTDDERQKDGVGAERIQEGKEGSDPSSFSKHSPRHCWRHRRPGPAPRSGGAAAARPGQAFCPPATTLLRPHGSPASADTATKGASGRVRATAGNGRPMPGLSSPPPLPRGDAGTAGRKHAEVRGHPRGCAYLVGTREERGADAAPTEAPQRPAGPRCPPRAYGWAALGGGGRALPGTERCAARHGAMRCPARSDALRLRAPERQRALAGGQKVLPLDVGAQKSARFSVPGLPRRCFSSPAGKSV
ncbi:hypothetical protein DV515_00015083 [Chloebia gouldiae]|uniref:Uncharacterized protein n=1 Tax=Chloebia gouldiae TaxID=44316 RepID=A0A3L8RW61_CHLGU|nr:hypothetical protein DV515_00015083 [Chloebia gouldiae]